MKSTEKLELEVANFGPIARAKIDLRPLTVFIGPSNTGKSYLAVLIYALHRFFGGGPLSVEYRSRTWDPHVAKDLGDETLRELFDLSESFRSVRRIDSPTLLPESVSALVRPLLESIGEDAESIDAQIRCFGVDATNQLIRHGSATSASICLRKYDSRTDDRTDSFEHHCTIGRTETRLSASLPLAMPLGIKPGRRFRLPRIHIPSRLRERIDRREFEAGLVLGELLEAVAPFVVGAVSSPAYYLPADRTGVMHAHRAIVRSLIRQAPFGGIRPSPPALALSGVMADFLETLIGMEEPRHRGRKQDNGLADRLESELLGGSVRIEKSFTDYPSFFYRPNGWRNDLPLMNASSMVSELAPVVLYLRHVVQPDDLLIIEEPESHLHPAMQVAFTRQLAAAVRTGVRIIITTHSEWVLETLANLVRMSELPRKGREKFDDGEFALSPGDVGAWLFEPKKRPKGSVVREIPLDTESGVFPAGFGDVAESLYNRWAEITNRIEESGS